MKKIVLLTSLAAISSLFFNYSASAQAIVNGGTYRIGRTTLAVPVGGRLSMQVTGNTALAPVVQAVNDNTDAFNFVFELQTGTTNEYKIRHRGTNPALYIQTQPIPPITNPKAAFSKLVQGPLVSNGSVEDEAQRWIITADTNPLFGYEFALKNSSSVFNGMTIPRQCIDMFSDAAGDQFAIFDDNDNARFQRFELTLIPLGTKNASESVLRTQAYPNPANQGQNLTVKVETIHNGSATVSILDVLGHTVHSQAATFKAGSNLVALSNKPLSAGVYIVRISQGDFLQQTRVVQQ
ncbi:T9SS type A sorting domain-containing protein [Hymenobacter sp.]|jgi:hypothetical protein|uniref:T9SS type A sorting domain-containing protein n=1 Tax=Hymenobacter sp. TaxID=1898978 RepID=UPI002EDB6B5D